MPDETEAPPEIRIRPDKRAVAIRTIFDDDSPGAVMSWLSVDERGISTYLSEAQVDGWKVAK